MGHTAVRRPLWLTLPFHVSLLAVLLLDIRTAFFRLNVGGVLGDTITLLAVGLAVYAAIFFAANLRRQLLRARSEDELFAPTTDGR